MALCADRERMKKVALLALVTLTIAGLLVACVGAFTRHVEVRGTLSADDVKGIVRAHRASCSTVWPRGYAKWFPEALRPCVAARLNPIDIIAVPKEGEAIVVYRDLFYFHYDKKGKHRGVTASHTFRKDLNGWHEYFLLP